MGLLCRDYWHISLQCQSKYWQALLSYVVHASRRLDQAPDFPGPQIVGCVELVIKPAKQRAVRFRVQGYGLELGLRVSEQGILEAAPKTILTEF